MIGVLEEGKEEVAREECRGVLDQIVIEISIDNGVFCDFVYPLWKSIRPVTIFLVAPKPNKNVLFFIKHYWKSLESILRKYLNLCRLLSLC